MKKLVLVLAVALVFGVGSLVAQTFPDVPWDHWAYDAVATLAEKGIVVGYPDGYFKGDRSLTRYEFACALRNALERLKAEITPPGTDVSSLQNAINDLRSRVEALEAGAPGVPSNLLDRVSAVEQQLQQAATKQELEAVRDQVADLQKRVAAIQVTPEDVQTLRRLINEFRDELATLGVDVDEMRRDLDALTQRLVALEERVGKFSVSGSANYIVRAEQPDDTLNPPIDLNGNYLKPNDKLLQSLFTGYDVDINMGFKASETTDVVAAIWGRDFDPWSMTSIGDTATIYKLYVTSALGDNSKLTVGKFPFQLTPYTLKLVDPDVYTYIPKFDEGNYIVSGGQLDLDLKPAKLSLFAAQNSGADELRIYVPGPTVDQFAGARLELSNLSEFLPELGLTYYRAGLSNPGWVDAYAEVYGANIVITPVKNLSILGEWAQFKADDDTGAATIDDDNNAYDAAIAYTVNDKLMIKGGYKQVEGQYYAPGYWDRILFLRNPSDIKGGYGDISWTAAKNLSLNLHGGFYEIDQGYWGTAGDELNHYTAALKYALTSKLGLQLGYEYLKYKPEVGDDSDYGYLTVGLSYGLGKDAAFNLLYQNINLQPAGTGDIKGDLIVTQVSVKF